MLPRLLLFCLLIAVPAAAAEWRLDPGTRILVEVPWQKSVVTVRFPTIAGSVQFDETDLSVARASISVATANATTGLAPVDQLLRSKGYLDAASYPQIRFRLDRLEATSRSTAKVHGRITLRDRTLPEEFEATVIRFSPAQDDPDRFEAGFDVTGTIDRTAYGSTAGLPEIAAELTVRVRLLMSRKR